MAKLTRDELLSAVASLSHQVVVLTRRVTELTAENSALRDQLEEARRAAARSAAPFRRPDAQKIPAERQRRPGRPAGHPGVCRPTPPIIDETIVVPPPAECPHCRGPVTDVRPVVQIIEEVPVARPRVTHLTTHGGTCARCGAAVVSAHPLQTGRGAQASRVQLGPRALAIAAALNKQHGLTMRQTCRVLHTTCGLRLSPGGLSQALDRLADRLEPSYQAIFADLRAGAATYVDETSWWVGGPQHWLWTFTSAQATLYQVRGERTAAVVTDVLTPHYAGVLISDCLNIYDTVPFARKHKCIAHHQKAIREQLGAPGLADTTYLLAWKQFFRLVIALCRARSAIPAELWDQGRRNLGRQRDELLDRAVTQEPDRRIQFRLGKQRAHLLTCLDDPAVEPTNNRAERALRPAVIARKVSCGNKTARGARTWERLASLLRTWTQRGAAAVDELARRSPMLQPVV